MDAYSIFLLTLSLGIFAFYLGRGRSLNIAGPLGGIQHLHSLPSYYGLNVMLWCALPSFVLLILWLIFDDLVINSIVLSALSEQVSISDEADYNLIINKIANISDGVIPAQGQPQSLLAAASHMTAIKSL